MASGAVRWVRTTAELEEQIPAWLGARELAVDTEFHAENTYLPKPMLLQVCAERGEVVIVDLLAGVDLRVLGRVFGRVPLLVHAGRVDVQILERLVGVRPTISLDVQVAAGCVGQGYPVRLGELAWRNLGIEMGKGETLSDWSRRPLGADQLEYAAEDVRILGRLASELRTRLAAEGWRAGVAAAATAELVLGEEEPDGERWRAVGGAHLLDGPGRAALQRLAAWRERAARERGVARPAVVTDGLLLDLARRRPATLEAMAVNRRMPGPLVRRDGEAMLGALRGEEARRAVGAAGVGSVAPLPLWGKPRIWVEMVRAAARVAEAERGVAVEIALPESALMALSHGETLPLWRQEALGPDFMEFLGGGRSIGLNRGWCRSCEK